MLQGNFDRLKGALEKRFRESFPHCPPIRDWKGEDIVLFQEELAEKVKGRVSEKWFYTHIKSGTPKALPRIDMLNMLSRYVGAVNWDDFCQQENALATSADKQRSVSLPISPVPQNQVSRWIWTVGGTGLLLLGLFAFMGLQQNRKLCFVDADGGELLLPDQLFVEVIEGNQSPFRLAVDTTGCVWLKGKKSSRVLVVDGPYYQRDTLYLESSELEHVALRKDDYALMIHYFSTARLEDWQKRRAQLDEMISDRAKIFQVWEADMMGMEMFNKEEFINKMTTPISSLRNLEILETRYEAGKIISLRFVQREKTP